MAAVRIGQIGRPHGLQGEMALDDCPLSLAELQRVGAFSWRARDGAERRVELVAAREVHGRFLVRFRGYDGRDAARVLTLGQLYADEAQLPDPGPGVAYAFQLVGLAVDTEDGRRLGVLESIVPTGANRVFVVQGEREWLIPATEEVLRRVDLERGVITVALPPGLEEI
jgi:16S rRNA processing protein RimM